MRWLTLLILLPAMGLAQPPAEKLLTAADAVLVAAADLATLPPATQQRVGYLSMHNLPMAEWAEKSKVLSGHANALSVEPDIQPLHLSGGFVLRVNLDDYGWKRATWEAAVDPWFYVVVEKDWPGGIWPGDGKNYGKGTFRYKDTILAPWLTETEQHKAAVAYLATATYSKVPILRADWFLNQTAMQEGRKAGYYDFLGLKDQKDFDLLVRFDKKLGKDLEHRRVVAFSGITWEPRRVQIDRGVLGAVYRTFDQKRGTAVDKANAIRVLDDDFTFAATEQFGPLPNGWPVWWLANNKGVRQDKAPDDVVRSRVDANLSCLACHFQEKKEMGIKEVFSLKIAKLSAVEYQKYHELRRQYLRNNAATIKQTREQFEEAIREATGWDGFTYNQKFQAFFYSYEDARITPQRAARELGLNTEVLIGKLKAYDHKPGNLDPVLSILMNGGDIPQRQWEEAFPLAQFVIRGYQP